jgi:pentatricopeptide repeat protein
MLRLSRIAQPLAGNCYIVLPLETCRGSPRQRYYSSALLNSQKSQSVNPNVIARTWGPAKDMSILDRLLLLVKDRKFDELLRTVKDDDSVKPIILTKLIQSNFGELPFGREVEVKEKILEIMKERGIRLQANSIAAMIYLYGKMGNLDKADAMLVMMKETGIKRDSLIYNSLMKCHVKNTSRVDCIYAEMIDDGIKPGVYLHNTLIDAYSKTGNLGRAADLYDSMKGDGIKPNLATYNSMIDVYTKNGELERVKETFSLVEGLRREKREKEEEAILERNVCDVSSDMRKISRFRGKEKDHLALETTFLTSFVECPDYFEEKGVDEMQVRCVGESDTKTTDHEGRFLESDDWDMLSAKLDGLE